MSEPFPGPSKIQVNASELKDAAPIGTILRMREILDAQLERYDAAQEEITALWDRVEEMKNQHSVLIEEMTLLLEQIM